MSNKKIFIILMFFNALHSSAQTKTDLRQLYSIILDSLQKGNIKEVLFSKDRPLVVNAHTWQPFNQSYLSIDYRKDVLNGMKNILDSTDYRLLQTSLEQEKAEIVIDSSIIDTRKGIIIFSCNQGKAFYRYMPDCKHLQFSNPLLINKSYCIVTITFGEGRDEFYESRLFKKENGRQWRMVPNWEISIMY